MCYCHTLVLTFCVKHPVTHRRQTVMYTPVLVSPRSPILVTSARPETHTGLVLSLSPFTWGNAVARLHKAWTRTQQQRRSGGARSRLLHRSNRHQRGEWEREWEHLMPSHNALGSGITFNLRPKMQEILFSFKPFYFSSARIIFFHLTPLWYEVLADNGSLYIFLSIV